MAEYVPPQAVVLDLYNTLIDIRTEEHAPEVWGRMADFLSYLGVQRGAEELLDQFRRSVYEQQRNSREHFPEIDMVRIFGDLLGPSGDERTAVMFCQLFRSLGMRRLQLFPDTLPCLQALHGRVKLALVSDAQRIWLIPEMARLQLSEFFPVKIISSDYGFRKPDTRLFEKALAELGVEANQAVMVGDSAFRDIKGAQDSGMRACLITRHAPFEAADAQVTPDLFFPTLVDFVAWVQGKSPAVRGG